MAYIEFLISQIILIVLGGLTLIGTIYNGIVQINNPIMKEKRNAITCLRKELIKINKILSSQDILNIPIDNFKIHYRKTMEIFEQYRPYIWETHKRSIENTLTELIAVDCSIKSAESDSIKIIYNKTIDFLRQFLNYSEQELTCMNKVPIFMRKRDKK